MKLFCRNPSNRQQLLFDNQERLRSGNIGETLHSFAGQISGVDADEVTSCMQNNQNLTDWLRSDIEQSGPVGVSGTPGLVFYRTGATEGTRLVGARPYQAFKQAIDAELN